MDNQTEDIDRALALIDREELTDLALTLANIFSPSGQEKPVAEFVEEWLRREGFETRVVSLLPDRPNVVGTYAGSGGGYSLLFNSHMDVSTSGPEVLRVPMRREICTAWREGELLYGMGLVNDKGPMACFLSAAKAIRKAGIVLKGDLIVTGVSGEIEREPVDEFVSPQYLSHEVGARFMVTHGVVADFALVAETTQFHVGWIEAGQIFFKITVFGGHSLYTPYLDRPYNDEENPNAIIRVLPLVEKIEDWAVSYEKNNTYVSPGGTLIPKVNVGAIRGGAPYRPNVTPELCSLYVDCRTTPGQDVLAVKEELERMVRALNLDGVVEPYVFRRGHEAKNIDRLAGAISRAHRRVFGEEPTPIVGPQCSMWRDVNAFNEVGIPALTYGPAAGSGGGNVCLSVDDLYRSSQIYAMVALDLCNQEKMER